MASDGARDRGDDPDQDQDRGRDRDRDATGRARNARPRDGLGRPLPYGVAGVPRQPEGVVRTPAQTLAEAQRLLDAGRPFHAHEVFEDAWKARPGDGGTGGEERLWKGLAQLAVGVTHQRRGNAVGGNRLLTRAAATLAPFDGDRPHGIDVAGLRRWALDPTGDAPRLVGPASRPDAGGQPTAGAATPVGSGPGSTPGG